jgi:hypothetical protein
VRAKRTGTIPAMGPKGACAQPMSLSRDGMPSAAPTALRTKSMKARTFVGT